MKGYRFSVYQHRLADERGNMITRDLIVLRDGDKDIIAWTDFGEYIKTSKTKASRNIYSGQGKRAIYIAALLNYVFFGHYRVKSLKDVTAQMVGDFFSDYGMCLLPGDGTNEHREEATVNKCIASVLDFFALFARKNKDSKMNLNDLFREEEVFDRKKRRYVKKKVPNYEVYFKPGKNKTIRDMPESVFQIIMNIIVLKHRNILMLAALGAFAGLRPAECCNARREDSPLGAGLRFEVTDGSVTNVYIDLSEKKTLRSDLKDVGGIKKKRTQKVYPAFLGVFVDCYNLYMEHIEGRKYEADYGPLTINRDGNAYTYDSYLAEFKNVVSEAVPEMLKSDDPKLVHFGHLLMQRSVTPHILRHWFSVKLTLYGEDVSGLMYWRGDNSPESALTYLMNKSELEKEYEKVGDEIFGYSLWRASKIAGEQGK